MLRGIVFILVALQCLTLMQTRNRRFQLEVHNVTCQIMTARMTRFDCYFKKVSDNHFVFNQFMMFSRNLGKEFQARLLVRILPRNGKKTLTFLDVKLKVCEALLKPFEGKLLTLLLNDIKRSSNIPRKCPIKGNFPYKVTNETFTDEFLPAYTPFLNFTYIFEFYDNEVVFAASKVTGATVPNVK